MAVSLEDPDLDETQRGVEAELESRQAYPAPPEERLNFSAPEMPREDSLDYGDRDWGSEPQQQSALALGPPAYPQRQQPQEPSLGQAAPYAPPRSQPQGGEGRGNYPTPPPPLPVAPVTGGRNRAPVKFDVPVEGAKPFFAAGAEPAKKAGPSWWDDFSNQVIVGAQGLGADGLAAAEYAAKQLVNDPRLAGYMEQQRATLEQSMKARIDEMSPEAKQAWTSSLFDKDAPLPADIGAYVSSAVASAVPSIVMALVPGGIVGKVLAISARGVALGAKTAGVVGTTGRIATTAGAFGTTQAGQMYGALSNELRDASDETLMTNPEYAKDRHAGVSVDEAKANILRKIGPAMAAQFALGAATGVGLGEVLPGGGPKLLHPATRRGAIATGAAEGAVTMGTQAGGGNLITQGAQVQAGLRPQIDPEEAARKAAGGVVGGAVIGGTAGTVRGLRPGEAPPRITGETEETGPPPPPAGPGRPTGTTSISPENQAALGQALSTGTPIPPPPPGGGAPPGAAHGNAPGALSTEPLPTNRSLVVRPRPLELDDPLPPDPTTGGPTSRAPPTPDGRAVDEAVRRAYAGEDPAAIEQQHGVYAARAAQHIVNRTPVNDVYAQHGPDVAALVNDRYQSEAAQRRAVQPQPMPERPPNPLGPAERSTVDSMRQRDGLPGVPEPPVQGEMPLTGALPPRGAEPGPFAGRPMANLPLGDQPVLPFKGGVTPSLPERPAAPARQQPERGLPGARQVELPGLPEPPVQGEMPLTGALPRGPAPPETPAREATQPGMPLGDQPSLPFKGGVPRPLGEGGVAPELRPVPTKGGGGEAAPTEKSAPPRTKGEAAPPVTAALMTKEGREKPLNKGEQLKAEQAARAEVEPPRTKAKVETPPAPKLTPKQIRAKVAEDKRRQQADRAEKKARFAKEANDEEGPEAQRRGIVVETVKDGETSSTTRMVEPIETTEAPSPADSTTSSVDRGRMIEERLASGDIDVHQAEAEYGAEPAGRGRPRAKGAQNFRGYLETRIGELQDHLEALDKRALSETDPAIQARISAETTATQSRLAELAGHATQLDNYRAANTGPEARARFRAQTGLDESAAARAAGKPKPLGSEDGGEPEGQGLFGRETHRKLFSKESHDVVAGALSSGPRPVHDFINSITNSAHVRAVLPEVAMMARKLADMVRRDVKVMSFEDAAAHSPFMADYIAARPNLQGFFLRQGNTKIIAIKSQGVHGLHTIMHEMFHSVTSEFLDRHGGSNKIGQGSRTSGPIQVLDAIAREVATHDMSHLTSYEQNVVAYALSNYHELHTMLMTSPLLRDIVAEIKPSQDFQRAMARQGYKLGERQNVWSAFVGWVRRVTGMEKVGSTNLLDHIIRPIEDITGAADLYNNVRSSSVPMAARHYEEVMPRDPELRGVASQVFDALDASERGEGRIHDSIDPGTIPGYSEAVRRGHEFFGTQRRPAGTEGRAGRLRPAALTFAPNVQIVEHYKDAFTPPVSHLADGSTAGGRNLLEDWHQAEAKQRKAEKDFQDTHDPVMRDIMRKFTDVGDRGGEGVSSLWRDATTEDIRLDPAGRGSNEVNEENAARVNDLYSRYDALNAKEKDAYNSGRRQYEILYEAKRDAELENVATMAFPEATRPQLDALKTALKTRRGTEQLLSGAEPSQLREQLGEAVLRDRDLVQRVAEIASYGHHNGYGPLQRHGDFVVTWGERDTPQYGVRMFDRLNDAETFRRQLVDRRETDVSQVSSRARQHLSAIARPNEAVDRIVQRVDAKLGPERADEMRQLLSGMMLDAMGRGAKSRMRRQGVRGADPITAQVIARDFASLTSKMGFVAGGADRSLALNAMRRHVEAVERSPNGRLPGESANAPFRDAVAMRHVLHEAEARVPRTDDNSPAILGATRRATRFAYAHQLLSLSHIAVNTVESSLLGASHMFGRHNPVRVALAMSRATASILPRALLKGGRLAVEGIGRELQRADWDVNKILRDHAIAAGYDRATVDSLYQTLEREGMGGHTMAAEMRRMAKEGFVPRESLAGRGIQGVGAVVDRASDIISISQHFAEAGNRWAVALAAHQLERGKGASVADATNYALRTLRQSVPDFGGKARIATAQGMFGKWGSPLMQFRNYGLFYTSMMAGTVQRALRASDPVTRREAQRALAGIIATQAAAVGVLSWTADPTRYLLGAYDLITGRQHPHNYQNDIQRWLASHMGPTMAELVAKGGIRYTTGMSLNDRMGSKNVLNLPEVNTFNDPKAWVGALGSFAIGASGETQAEYLTAANKLASGDFLGGSKGLLPRIIADPIKAWDRAAHGIRDSRGKVGLPADKISTASTVMQALGVRPAAVANYFEGRSAITEYQQEQKELHDRALRAYTDSRGSVSGQKAFRDALALYNRTYPAQPITAEALRGVDTRQAERTRDPRTYGVYLPKKAIPAATAAASFIPR